MATVEELEKSLGKSIDDLGAKAKKIAQEVKELRDFKQEVEAVLFVCNDLTPILGSKAWDSVIKDLKAIVTKYKTNE